MQSPAALWVRAQHAGRVLDDPDGVLAARVRNISRNQAHLWKMRILLLIESPQRTLFIYSCSKTAHAIMTNIMQQERSAYFMSYDIRCSSVSIAGA